MSFEKSDAHLTESIHGYDAEEAASIGEVAERPAHGPSALLADSSARMEEILEILRETGCLYRRAILVSLDIDMAGFRIGVFGCP